MGIRDWITAQLGAFLSKPLSRYERRGWNDIEGLKHHTRKGDVLLVEGDLRVSAVIRYLTQSSWSHAALYIGDELLRRGEDLKRRTLETFGDDAQHLLVEALHDGVVVSALSKYVDLNIRLCRPHRLRPQDLAVVLDDAVGAIGWRYDLRNILDLAVHLAFVSMGPGRESGESARHALGSAARTEVMCTSLLGRLFHRVGFPVLPDVTFPDGDEHRLEDEGLSLRQLIRRRRDPYRAIFRRRHPTLLQPRDFDLSPYFEIVKFNHVANRGFDYSRIAWVEDVETEDEEVA